MKALRRSFVVGSRRAAVALGMALGTIVLGCSGGSGGGGGDLALLSFNLENVRSVFLNERLVFKFTEPIDPASVNANTIRIRYDASMIDRNGDGQADNPNDTNAAPEGVFTVSGDTVFFDPKLPSDADNSDPGLVPSYIPIGTSATLNIIYSVTIPAPTQSSPASVKSTRGRAIVRTFQSTFQTVFDPTFPPDISSTSFFDVFPGRPFIRSVEATPSQFGADPNSVISVVFSEPILPSSLSEDDSIFLEAIGPSLGRAERVTASVFIEQLPAATRVTFRPTITLPGGVQVNIRATEDIRDFGGNRLSLTEPGTPPLVVQVLPTATQSGFFQETFDTPDNEDVAATGASWANGVLLPGAGGDASDGPFRPTTNTVIDTTVKTLYQFSSFEIPEGVTVTVIGPNACRIFAASTVTILGNLNLNGVSAATATSAGPSAGGRGGAGGFAGGDGAGGPGGFGGNGLGPGGGFGSISSAVNQTPDLAETASGGGGASYSQMANPGDSTGRTLAPGLPGLEYGDPTLNPALGFLLGGSGGGGAGWSDRQNSPGSGGGGGGGALQLQAGRGITLIKGVNTAGMLTANGGNGGENQTALGAGGGGGSGGGLLIQSGAGNVLVGADAAIRARFGTGGVTADDPGDKGRGGNGSLGRIRIEIDQSLGFALVTAGPGAIDPQANPVEGAQFDFAGVVSVGTTQFFDTRTLFPNYTFVPGGVIPGVGLPYSEDNSFLFAPGTIVYLFQGAPEDPDNPGLPDLDQLRPPTFTFNIDEVDDSRFIRVQVLFVTPTPVPPAPPAVEAVRFSYTFN